MSLYSFLTGTAFFGCYHRIFPSALQESLLLKPRQRPVEGPVAGKEAGGLPVLDFPGGCGTRGTAPHPGREGALRRRGMALSIGMSWPAFSSHDVIIDRYLPFVECDLSPSIWAS